MANFNAAMGIFEEMVDFFIERLLMYRFFFSQDEADEDDLYPLLLNLRKIDAFHQ